MEIFHQGGGAQWTNTGLDPQISKFSGQEWTGTDEEGGMVRNAPKIKSRECSGKVPGKKKKKKKKSKSTRGLGLCCWVLGANASQKPNRV